MRASCRLSIAVTVPAARRRPRASASPSAGGSARRPCASMIASICASARPDSRMSRAMRQPSPPRTSGSNSITRPARRSAFSRRSAGASGVVAQHAHHVARLEHRADAAADRLAAVGDHHLELQVRARRRRTRRACAAAARPASNAPWRWARPGCRAPGGSSRRRSSSTGSTPPSGPASRCASGRSTEIRMSSAGDSPALPPQARQPLRVAHDLRQPLEGQLDLGQHLHRVGGAGRRGDRARRGLRAQHAVRRDDGHDQHRGAIARDAADAMLVDDRAAAHLRAASRAGGRRRSSLRSGAALLRGRGRSRSWRRRRRRARSSNSAPAATSRMMAFRSSRVSRSPSILRCSAPIEAGGSAGVTLAA